jgi:glycogen synthase
MSQHRVLMFGWEFPPYVSGGLGTACFGLTKSMVAQNCQILFVVPRAEKTSDKDDPLRLIGGNTVGPLREDELMQKQSPDETFMQIIPLDAYLRPYHGVAEYYEEIKRLKKSSPKQLQELFENSVIDIKGDYGPDLLSEVGRYARLGTRLALRESFDVIHAHDWLTYLAGVEAKRQSGKPLVVHVHATEFDRSGASPNPAVYDIERYGMDHADRVITVSQRTANTVMQHYNVPVSKIRVVHNGVIKDKSVEKGDVLSPFKEKTVLFLGRVTMQKGPEFFVDAAVKVLKVLPNVRFVMAGSGDKLTAMIDRIASLRLQDHFHFTGFLRGTDTEKMFALSDLFIMPSVSEPFGITPIEAMKYKVPTIVSKQSGVAEILENTIKVDFWDTDALAKAILLILQDEDVAKKLAVDGYDEVSRITWDKAATKVLSIYDELHP